MKRFSVLLGIALGLALVLSAPIYGQANSATDKNFTGQILAVDIAAKTLSVRDPDGKEMIFHYDSDTQIINQDKAVQGLSGKDGARVLITYREEMGSNLATRIEITTGNDVLRRSNFKK